MSEQWNPETTIVTPEHVQLQFQTAGVGSRAAAFIIDGILLLLGNGILLLLMALLTQNNPSVLEQVRSYAVATAIILAFVLNFGYFIILEYARGGQSIGKRVLGIRVLQNNGQSITFLSSVIRNLFRIIDAVPLSYLLGILVIFFHPKDKRIGDLVAGTMVVQEMGNEKKRVQKKINKVIEKSQPSLPSFMLEEQEKSKLERDDWKIIATFMERLPNLSKQKATEFIGTIGAHLFQKMELMDVNKYGSDGTAFIIAVYMQIRDDWEI